MPESQGGGVYSFIACLVFFFVYDSIACVSLSLCRTSSRRVTLAVLKKSENFVRFVFHFLLLSFCFICSWEEGSDRRVSPSTSLLAPLLY